jgi:alginate O-acetyltransferase complex protein AlgI
VLFSSSVFIFIFLPFVLFGYYGLFRKSRKCKNIFLTFCSLFFYAWGEPWFVLIMILSIIGNWGFALWIDKICLSPPPPPHKLKINLVITLMLTMNLGILFVFKYLTFILKNINTHISNSINVPNIVLPIGISFFTFQAISYVIDVYRKDAVVQKNPLNVALYISFFPQLIAGPIVRYQTIAEQIQNRQETFDDFSTGMCRFIVGLGKKMILANTLASVADIAFGTQELSVVMAWQGALAYTFQIFYDFSGYSDMAIGLGRMFGFKFLENFDYPYIAGSITEFWRRWHISLGTWFRDYVYFPLGGSRVKTRWRLIFNLFTVWILTGIWHGANWTFLAWGVMYFLLILFEKISGIDIKKWKVLGHLYTMFFVIMGWVLFRAPTLSYAFAYMARLFGINANGFLDRNAIFYFNEHKYYYLLAVFFTMPLNKWIKRKISDGKTFSIFYPVGMILLFVIAISFVVKGSYNPFIYFNF